MAQIVLLVDRFYSIRKILNQRKYYTHRRKGANDRFSDTYSRQRARKLEQKQLFKSDPRFKEFFDWVFSIQDRLKVTDAEFARLCGVTFPTISMWRHFDGVCGGHFPSKAQFKRLMRLEIVCLAKIIIEKDVVKLRKKSGVKPVVTIPRGRLRLQANVPY